MNPEWVQVRLRRPTLAKLRAWAETTLKHMPLVQEGIESVQNERGLGVDVAVAILLDRDVRHRERARKKK